MLHNQGGNAMEKKYTVENYKNLIEEFFQDVGFSEKQKDYMRKPCIYNNDLFNLSTDEYKRLVLTMSGKSQNPQYLLENKNYLNRFLAWADEKGYIESNPFETEEGLSIKELVKAQSDLLNMDILYPEKIYDIVRQIPQNKNYYGMLIYGFYEGIRSTKEFAEIKISDIDFDKNTIKLKNRTLNGSEILFSLIRGYINETEHIRSRMIHKTFDIVIDTKDLVQVGDYLIKDKLGKNVSHEDYLKNIDFEKRISLVQKRISKDFLYGLPKLFEMYGLEIFDLTIDLINKSGFIDFAKHKLYYYDNKQFCDVFVGDDPARSGEWCRTIESIAKEFGEPGEGKGIRYRYKTHIMKSRYYD